MIMYQYHASIKTWLMITQSSSGSIDRLDNKQGGLNKRGIFSNFCVKRRLYSGGTFGGGALIELLRYTRFL